MQKFIRCKYQSPGVVNHGFTNFSYGGKGFISKDEISRKRKLIQYYPGDGIIAKS